MLPSSRRKSAAIRRKCRTFRRLRSPGSNIAWRLAHSSVLVCNGTTPISLLDP